MDCHECARTGTARTAIAVCRFCSVGLCKAITSRRRSTAAPSRSTAASTIPSGPSRSLWPPHRQRAPRRPTGLPEMHVRSLLLRLEDFRLLPVFVAVSMVVGIAIGGLLSISDFALTPPIDALKSIGRRDVRAERARAHLARRAHRPVRDDVPGDDQCAPGRGRGGLPLPTSAGRGGHPQLPRRAIRDAAPRPTCWWRTPSCGPA